MDTLPIFWRILWRIYARIHVCTCVPFVQVVPILSQYMHGRVVRVRVRVCFVQAVPVLSQCARVRGAIRVRIRASCVQVVPVLSQALTEMCTEEPDDAISWLANWLQVCVCVRARA